jgi:hypothetical protein
MGHYGAVNRWGDFWGKHLDMTDAIFGAFYAASHSQTRCTPRALCSN